MAAGTETFPQIDPGAFLEPAGPVVDGLTTDAQGFGDRLDRLALIEPEQHLGPTSLLGQGGVGDEILQIAALPSAEFEQSHRPLGKEGRSSITHCICQRTSGHPDSFSRGRAAGAGKQAENGVASE